MIKSSKNIGNFTIDKELNTCFRNSKSFVRRLKTHCSQM